MRLKPIKGQRWRVSVYSEGVRENVPKGFPLVHHASRVQATARAHYDRYVRMIGTSQTTGKADLGVGRVIMHQGLLYRGDNAYIEEDSQWGLHG